MKRDPLMVWVVDGTSMTERRIACRLGVSVETVRRRIANVLASGAGLTWHGLRAARYAARGAA